MQTDSDTLTWGAAVTRSIDLSGAPAPARADGAVPAHFPPGLLSLIAEINGEHALDGDQEGSGTAEWILGASYSVSPRVEVRGGFAFPAWTPRDFDHGFILGVIYHF